MIVSDDADELRRYLQSPGVNSYDVINGLVGHATNINAVRIVRMLIEEYGQELYAPPAMLQQLIKRQADNNRRPYTDMINLYIEKMTNRELNERINIFDEGNPTAIEFATKKHLWDVVDNLYDHGAVPNIELAINNNIPPELLRKISRQPIAPSAPAAAAAPAPAAPVEAEEECVGEGCLSRTLRRVGRILGRSRRGGRGRGGGGRGKGTRRAKRASRGRKRVSK